MTQEHPNISLMKRLDSRNLSTAGDLSAQEFIWRFFNPPLAEACDIPFAYTMAKTELGYKNKQRSADNAQT